VPTVFVGTAKSVYVAPYGAFERTVLRRAHRIFVRDAATAERLRAQGVAAEAPGNVIVDLALGREGAPAGTWLGILPGSRDEAYADGTRLARVLRAVAQRSPDVGGLISLASTIDVERFGRALAADGWSISPERDPGGRAISGLSLRRAERCSGKPERRTSRLPRRGFR
jgi:uncharacterized protein (TIGR03492 family)